MKKLLLIILFFPFLAFAAPTTTYFFNIAPTTANTYDNGTAALPWLHLFTKYASTTQLTVSEQLLLLNTPSSLLVTDSDGLVGQYGGAVCFNQFVESIDPDGAFNCEKVTDAFFDGTLSLNHGGTNNAGVYSLGSLIYYDGTQLISTSSNPLYVGRIVATSTTATSTFANGIALSRGCFSMPDGTCVLTSATATSTITGTTGQVVYLQGNNSPVGTSTLFISPASFVGIRTTSPLSPLDVYRNDADTTQSVSIQNSGGGDAYTAYMIPGSHNYSVGVDFTGNFAIAYKNTSVGGLGTNPRINITSSGQVGIGINSGQSNKLDVNGNASIGAVSNFAAPTNGLLVDGATVIGTTTYNGNVLTLYSPTAAATEYSGAGAGSFTIGYDVSNGRFSIASSSALGTTDRFIITSAGNVGIGTTSPATTFSVNGNGYFTSRLGVGKVATAANSIDVVAQGAYRYNNAIIAQGSSTLSNWYFGQAGNNTQTGTNNVGLGVSALAANTTGSHNIAIGQVALTKNTTGHEDIALGMNALSTSTSTINNLAIGFNSLQKAADPANSNTGFGSYTLSQLTYGADNTAIGLGAGSIVTTGNNNILIGVNTNLNLGPTTGNKNILIGHNMDLPSPTTDNQLDIGNIIYGTTIDGNGGTLSSGKIGIGTTTPGSLLTVNGDIGTDGTNVTVTSCGTGAAVTVGSTDTAGEITEGTVATGCTISFATTKTNAPFCVATSEAGLAFSFTESTTALTVTNIGALSSTKITYHCIQNNL